MAARGVVGINVGLAEAFRHSAKFGFIAAGFKHRDTVIHTRVFVGCDPTAADSVTTSGHTIDGFTRHGFPVESGNRSQRQPVGDQRSWQHCGRPTARKFCAYSWGICFQRGGFAGTRRQARS
jgi:hypothetical protein